MGVSLSHLAFFERELIRYRVGILTFTSLISERGIKYNVSDDMPANELLSAPNKDRSNYMVPNSVTCKCNTLNYVNSVRCSHLNRFKTSLSLDGMLSQRVMSS